MKPFKTNAYVYSLNKEKLTSTEKAEITVLTELTCFSRPVNNAYVVDYKGTLCSAIYNFFSGSYYADDVYGKLTENDENYLLAKRLSEKLAK